MRRSTPGQSIVETALMAPVLIVLLLICLDVGRVFSIWIALGDAAREGAYVAAVRFSGDTPAATVQAAVANAAGDIAVTPNATYVTVVTSTPGVVDVTARAPFDPVAPLVDSLWGGGSVWISASSSFPVPVRTPTPTP